MIQFLLIPLAVFLVATKKKAPAQAMGAQAPRVPTTAYNIGQIGSVFNEVYQLAENTAWKTSKTASPPSFYTLSIDYQFYWLAKDSAGVTYLYRYQSPAMTKSSVGTIGKWVTVAKSVTTVDQIRVTTDLLGKTTPAYTVL